jgi:hypothetical protein
VVVDLRADTECLADSATQAAEENGSLAVQIADHFFQPSSIAANDLTLDEYDVTLRNYPR